ncbi:MAG: hypothetical protein ACM3O9_00820 [Methylocystaceae bacterium]
MEKILIGLEHSVDHAVVNRISTLIADLRSGDEVIITLESAEEQETEPVKQVLAEHGFKVQEQGQKEGKTYILAQRMYH